MTRPATLAAATLAALALVPAPARADVPGMIHYQGHLEDAGGVPFSGRVDMTFGVYATPEGGEPLWSEAFAGQDAVAVADGELGVYLGETSPLSADLFTGGERWLGVSVGEEGELLPRQRIAGAPYALLAGAAEHATTCDEALALDGLGRGELATAGHDHGELYATTEALGTHAGDVAAHHEPMTAGRCVAAGEAAGRRCGR